MIHISLIITTFNEEKYLPVLLNSIANQKTQLNYEVIIVDDHSSDKSIQITESFAKHYSLKILLSKIKHNVTAMRNQGLKAAKGVSVLFLDADCAIPENYLEVMALPLIKKQYSISLCPQIYPLEKAYSIRPQSYSKTYSFLLKYTPKFIWRKIPIRVFPFLAKYKTMKKENPEHKFWETPDRVHTSAIIGSRDLIENIGGWTKAFGNHNDTHFCESLFNTGAKVKWQWQTNLFVSLRREFPTHELWFFERVLLHIFKLFRIDFIFEKQKKKGQEGYKDPSGKR